MACALADAWLMNENDAGAVNKKKLSSVKRAMKNSMLRAQNVFALHEISRVAQFRNKLLGG